MLPRLCFCWIWGLHLLIVLSGFAQQHYFHTYTGADGLSQLVVQTLLQDRQGYVWIGTQSGLNRFNGFGFEAFTLRDGLAGDFIWSLAEGRMVRSGLAPEMVSAVARPTAILLALGWQRGCPRLRCAR